MVSQRKQAARDLAGFLLLDKAPGMTSNRALQRARRVFDARKAGHTGSLDPLATGMLPVCFGAATKVAQFALAANKTYEVTGLLGSATDTGDADGKVICEEPVSGIDRQTIEAVLAQFRGPIEQVPPMYSALKHQGRRLYELARAGIEVERAVRQVQIHELVLTDCDLPSFSLRVSCSKGTYIRSLVADIAVALGTVGHVVALRRVSVDPFAGQRMWRLDELEELAESGQSLDAECLLPVDCVLAHWPRITLDAERERRIRHGQKLQLAGSDTAGLHAVYSEEAVFIGIGEVDTEGRLAPRRIFL